MIVPTIETFRGALLGRTCDPLRREADWAFTFGDGVAAGCLIATESWWRIVNKNGVVHSLEDDQQSFGLGAAIDGEKRARDLIGGRKVIRVSIRAPTSDLVVSFADEVELEILSSSSGYENWQAYFRDGEHEVSIIAGGGGALSFTSAPPDAKLTVARALPAGWAGEE